MGFLLAAFKGIPWLVTTVLGWLTGGTLDSIMRYLDRRVDGDVEKMRAQAEVAITYAKAQAQIVAGRTWWFQLFFVLPLGIWWTAVILDSVFFHTGSVKALPTPMDTWAGWIISALFVVDGSKVLIGRLKK